MARQPRVTFFADGKPVEPIGKNKMSNNKSLFFTVAGIVSLMLAGAMLVMNIFMIGLISSYPVLFNAFFTVHGLGGVTPSDNAVGIVILSYFSKMSSWMNLLGPMAIMITGIYSIRIGIENASKE